MFRNRKHLFFLVASIVFFTLAWWTLRNWERLAKTSSEELPRSKIVDLRGLEKKQDAEPLGSKSKDEPTPTPSPPDQGEEDSSIFGKLSEELKSLDKPDKDYLERLRNPRRDKRIPFNWISGPRVLQLGRTVEIGIPIGYVYAADENIALLNEKLKKQICLGECIVVSREFDQTWFMTIKFIDRSNRRRYQKCIRTKRYDPSKFPEFENCKLHSVPTENLERDLETAKFLSEGKAVTPEQRLKFLSERLMFKKRKEFISKILSLDYIERPKFDERKFQLVWGTAIKSELRSKFDNGTPYNVYNILYYGSYGNLSIQIYSRGDGLLRKVFFAMRVVQSVKFLGDTAYEKLPRVYLKDPEYIPEQRDFEKALLQAMRSIELIRAWEGAIP